MWGGGFPSGLGGGGWSLAEGFNNWNISPFSSSRRLHATAEAAGTPGGGGGGDVISKQWRPKWEFPLKAASTAGGLALMGDTIAQLRSRWTRSKSFNNSSADMAASCCETKAIRQSKFLNHDWLRALRMATYGFFIYGPASQVWYTFLDRVFWEKTLGNLSIKVALNQVILGPFVIAVVFAWNSLWQGKLKGLPELYHNCAASTLVDGWKFWIPASILNFGVIPLQARVAFMSCCSIFWNFYLSTAMGKS